MKKTLLVLGIFLIGFSFSSCDEDDIIGLLPDFDVPINQTENIPVHIDRTNGDRISYSETTDLNIKNKDTEDYLNKIKDVKITALSYKIINFSGDPIGDVEASFSVANEVSLQHAYVVKESADKGKVYAITEVDELSRIANALKSGQTVKVEYSGSALCDADDMDFTVEVTLVAKVTINP